MIPPDYKALETKARELDDIIELDDLREIADALSLAASLQDEIVEARKILEDGIDRDKADESLRTLAVVAVNGIYWLNVEIQRLQDEIERLKQAKPECEWTKLAYGDYRASCGIVTAATPIAGRVKFCFHCGKPLREVAPETGAP